MHRRLAVGVVGWFVGATGCAHARGRPSSEPGPFLVVHAVLVHADDSADDPATTASTSPLYTPVHRPKQWPPELGGLAFVEVRFCIDPRGKTHDAEIVRGPAALGPGVLADVAKWRYKPKLREGVPVDSCEGAIFAFSDEYEFDPTKHFTVAFEPADADAPYGRPAPAEDTEVTATPACEARAPVMTAPVPKSALGAMRPADDHRRWYAVGRMGVRHCVGTEGDVYAVRLDGVSRRVEPYAKALRTVAARDWAFTPATLDGDPVTVCDIVRWFDVYVIPRA